MNCALCGDVCRCGPEPPSTGLHDSTAELHGVSAGLPNCVVEPVEPSGALSEAWRDELSARLNQYRARRKVRPPRYPSLRLPFESAPVGSVESAPSRLGTAVGPASEGAFALSKLVDTPAPEENPDVQTSPGMEPIGRASSESSVHSRAKIIEFPRFTWGPPPAPPDQLAEPVTDRPRILEAPEITQPLPALGGITIEATPTEEPSKRPGIDVPLQSASLGWRLLASFLDALIIIAASGLFGLIFWKVAAVRPPQIQLLGLGLGVPAVFWSAYQYLMITFAATTPGLRLTGLKLMRFDETAPRRSLRRWRVLASLLSAASLGMGYVWVFLDEDGLCWHDRATRTHLARR